MRKHHRLRALWAILAVSVLWSGSAHAANVSWDDGGFLLGKDWSDFFNWSPNGSPAGDNLSIGNLPAALGDSTTIDQNFAISSLSLTNGADADTSGNVLDVDGNIEVSGNGSTFIASEHAGGPAFTTVMAEDVTLSGGGALSMQGGRVVLTDLLGAPANIAKVTVTTNSFLSGYGILRFEESLGGVEEIQLYNDGTFQTRRPTGANNTDRFTLTIEASDVNSRLDLDGSSDTGVVTIDQQTTLDLQVVSKEFHSTMTFEPGAILELSAGDQTLPLIGATVEVNAATALAGVPSTATIRGNLPTDSNAQINVNSGTLIFEDGLFLQNTSTIAMSSGAGLQFDSSSSILGDLDLNGSGINLVINGFTHIFDDSFDWDGSEDATTTISNSALSISSDDIEPGPGNSFDGTINLNSGTLFSDITGGWVFSGVLNMDSSSLVSSAETMTVDGGKLIVTGGLSEMRVPMAFTSNSAGSTSVSSSSTLQFTRNASFAGGSTHTGDGTIEFSATNGAVYTVNGNQVINMPSGTVVLDGDQTSPEAWQLNANLTIRADSLGTNNAFGDNSNTSTDAIFINNSSSRLSVNLTNANDEWTLSAKGLINILGGASPTISLAGSDLNIEGAIVVTDSTQFDARFDLESGGKITINTAGKELRLNNSGGSADPNTINGGVITGAGKLSSFGVSNLVGHGTISVDIALNGTSNLQASGGTLTVSGDILSAGWLGTKDDTGTLSLTQPLNTGNLTVLELNGGTVTTNNVSTINDGLILGHGLFMTNFLRNNGTIRANGGTLVVDTLAAPNLDGNNETGDLEAIGGSLQIVDAPADDLDGTITVGGGQFIDFQNGWNQGTAGTLVLNGGGASAQVRGGFFRLKGTVDVDKIARIRSTVTFRNTVTVNLPDFDDLLLVDNASLVQAGATFTGGGRLAVVSGAKMTLAHGADVGVQLESNGNLVIGSSPGEATVFGFTQFSEGTLFIEIGGTDANDYDRLIVEQLNATLAGELDVTLINGFAPSEGDSFPILQVIVGNLNGTFDTLAAGLPALPGGLEWVIDYSPATGEGVTLEVLAASLEGDFDDNGTVEQGDLDLVLLNWGSNSLPTGWVNNPPAFPVGSAALAIVRQNWGSTAASPANLTAVPEPSSFWTIVMGLAGLGLWRKRIEQ